MPGPRDAQPSGSLAPETADSVGANGVRETRPAIVVDMHTHFFPAGMRDLATETGDSRWPSLTVAADGSARIMRGQEVFRPVAETCWNLERRAEAMDEAGIDHHVLSPVPITLTTWADPVRAAQFARMQNEAFAYAVANVSSAISPSPETAAPAAPAAPATFAGRFSWIGSVPLQDTDRAIEELEFGVNQLGMLGVEIGSEVAGRELDDPTLRPFFAAAQDLDVAIFIHPTDGAGASAATVTFRQSILSANLLASNRIGRYLYSSVFGGFKSAFSAGRLRVGCWHCFRTPVLRKRGRLRRRSGRATSGAPLNSTLGYLNR